MLCATNASGLLLHKKDISWAGQVMTLELTEFELSLRFASDDKNFWMWSPIVFCDAIDQKLTTSASYPYVTFLASGRSLGRKDSGQQAGAPLAVHVDSRSFVRPRMNITLKPMINSQKHNVVGASLLSHYIDLVRVHHPQAEGWPRHGSASLCSTFACALKLNIAFLGPSSADEGVHDDLAGVRRLRQWKGCVAQWYDEEMTSRSQTEWYRQLQRTTGVAMRQ